MSDSYYDTAQICLNGHVVNTLASSSPQSNQKHCAECGAKTITACAGCHAPIRGYYHVPGVIGFFDYDKPRYCYNCGEAYPWTVASLEAAAELADELEGLSWEERQQLKDSFPDLVRETPKTVVAETRFKKLMKKAGSEAYDGMKAILINVVTEAVKKSLFGP
ncbi:DUF2321 domain-containing protein [Thioalkalivibrio sp. HL-Eb18]|uniref:DUF2321 domain-containing protein n=1 Tax=Thioalkalivibrio sp. HL-Eb18 TaxID=1266913 RepID=UPI0009D99853|nr:DUF2321 domain-containing protein [Thioalkalivibrio sp. HL-Eb18]